MSTGDAGGIRPVLRKLHADHPVRKTPAQKAAFRADALSIFQQAGWDTEVEHSGRLIHSDNLVAGDMASAGVIYTAHYDTPARLPFPNFIAPRNLAASLAYQILLALVLVIPIFGLSFLAVWLGLHPLLSSGLTLAVAAALIWLILAGPANPRNANDNTSGTLAVLEIALSLPAEARRGVALVLFDNEELGLVGSAAFRKKHGPLLEKLLINFDCVGDGDTLLFVLPKTLRRDEKTTAALASAFASKNGKTLLLDRSPFTLYPSDQLNFKRGIGVAATRRAPVVGPYLSRIHTGRDTVLDETNLAFLREGALRLAAMPVFAPAGGGGESIGDAPVSESGAASELDIVQPAPDEASEKGGGDARRG